MPTTYVYLPKIIDRLLSSPLPPLVIDNLSYHLLLDVDVAQEGKGSKFSVSHVIDIYDASNGKLQRMRTTKS